MQLAEDKKQKILDTSLGAIKHWLERFDTIIIGPGLGRDEMVHHVVIEVRVCALSPCIMLNCGLNLYVFELVRVSCAQPF